MRITNFFKKLKQLPKRYVVAVAAGLIIAAPIAVFAGFGPDRPTFDWNVNPGTCDPNGANNGDRCGSVTGPVFNSFINTPSYGDERNFARIAPVVAGQSPQNASYTETQTATAGNEYWVRTLVHNDANQNTNCAPEHRDPNTNDCTQIDPGSEGIAVNTRVKLEIASGIANGVDVMTKVSADNATPGTVWDTATLANGQQAFSVSYVPGSAVLYNDVHVNGVALSDNITSASGVQVGLNAMDGTVPGCFDFAAFVYVKVKVAAPALKFDKLVRFEGEDSTKWRDALTAESGKKVQYLLDFENTGSANTNNVVIHDQLPTNIALVPGTVRWIDINHPAPGQPVPDDLIFDKAGVNLGNYGVHGGGFIMFTATVKNEDKNACVAKNVGFVRADNVPEQSNDAVVTVANCQPSQPIYSCDLLDLTVQNKTVTISQFKTTATGGATFKVATINWNDNTTDLVTNAPVGKTHTFSGNGPFNVKATATFTVDGQDKNATSQSCAKVVSFTSTTPPTTLVDTGAGDVIGIFAATTVAGAVMYRLFILRRFDS